MERSEYLKIREQFKFEKKTFFLALQLLINASLVAGTFAFWSIDGAMKYLCVPLMVSVMFRSFALMHESSHSVTTKNRSLNDWLGVLNGCFCFLPFEGWKSSHLQHHLWSGNVEKDPVMAFILIHPKMSPQMKRLLNFCWLLWMPILGFVQNIVFWSLSLKTYFNEKRSLKYTLSLVLPLVSWATIVVVASSEFILTALVPSVIIYLLAVEVVNLPHHLQLPQSRGDTKQPVWNQYRSVRSCLYPRWFAQFFTMNFNYHIEHHMFPDAPWYYLSDIHVVVRSELKEEYNSDPYLKWFLENKRKPIEQVLAPPSVEQKKNFSEAG